MKQIKVILIFFITVITICMYTSCIQNTKESEEKKTGTLSESTNSEIKYEVSYKKVNTWLNSIGTMRGQVIVEITNTGVNPIYLSSSSYELENSNKQIVASKQYVSIYPNVLKPGEKGYLYNETSLDNSVSGQLNVIPRISAKKANISCLRYDISEISISDTSYFGPKIIGRITNTTDKDENGNIYVAAIIYNSNSEPIGVLNDIISTEFPKGTKLGFEAMSIGLPDSITANSIASYKIYAYPYQYQF